MSPTRLRTPGQYASMQSTKKNIYYLHKATPILPTKKSWTFPPLTLNIPNDWKTGIVICPLVILAQKCQSFLLKYLSIDDFASWNISSNSGRFNIIEPFTKYSKKESTPAPMPLSTPFRIEQIWKINIFRVFRIKSTVKYLSIVLFERRYDCHRGQCLTHAFAVHKLH